MSFLRRLWRGGELRQEPRSAPASPTGLSRTSQAVALIRAEFDRPSTPEGNPQAQRLLCAGMRPAGSTWLRPQLLARTRFFDDEVLRAISAGTRQIVICGAGYDDRALRFRTTGVRFFELDHPVTQADKARRLRDAGLVATGRETTESAGPGPALAPADFRTDDVAGVLAAHGQSAAEPGLFICEGLLVYLDERAIVELLTALARRAGPGSTLAASLSVHRAGADSERVKAVANARRRASRSEPWQTILPREAHLDLLREAGWVPDRAVDAADLAEGTDRDRSLLVTATLT